jgi:hypothetical protein
MELGIVFGSQDLAGLKMPKNDESDRELDKESDNGT